MTREQILDRARTVPIEVKVLALGEIKRLALQHFAKRNGRQIDTRKEDMTGIALAYVRHQLTNYNSLLSFFNKTSEADQAGLIVSDRVLQKIAAAYAGPIGDAAARLQQNRQREWRREPTIRVWRAAS